MSDLLNKDPGETVYSVSIRTLIDTVKTILTADKEEEFIAGWEDKGYYLSIEYKKILYVKEFFLMGDFHKGDATWNNFAKETILSPNRKC